MVNEERLLLLCLCWILSHNYESWQLFYNAFIFAFVLYNFFQCHSHLLFFLSLSLSDALSLSVHIIANFILFVPLSLSAQMTVSIQWSHASKTPRHNTASRKRAQKDRIQNKWDHNYEAWKGNLAIIVDLVTVKAVLVDVIVLLLTIKALLVDVIVLLLTIKALLVKGIDLLLTIKTLLEAVTVLLVHIKALLVAIKSLVLSVIVLLVAVIVVLAAVNCSYFSCNSPWSFKSSSFSCHSSSCSCLYFFL